MSRWGKLEPARRAGETSVTSKTIDTQQNKRKLFITNIIDHKTTQQNEGQENQIC